MTTRQLIGLIMLISPLLIVLVFIAYDSFKESKKSLFVYLGMAIWCAITIFLLCGCSWQGQKAYQDEKLVSEWWSMRFCWMSNGIESYTETPYYRSGASIKASQSDPNSIKATGETGGKLIGEAAKAVGGL